jgi:hypothetical protein
MSLDQRLQRLEERMRPRPGRPRDALERTIRRRLIRRAEAPDSSVASRTARAVADGQPGRATALLTDHMNR